MRKNDAFCSKNKRLEAHSCIFSRVLILLSMAIFAISLISGAEWDNVKSYDPVLKEVTLKNALGLPLIGENIAKVKLDTPLVVKVGLGYQKVAEFTIDSYADYPSFIQEFEIKNVRTGKVETKEIDLKYKSTKQVLVPEYKEVCTTSKDLKNATQICNLEKSGEKYETQEEWLPLEKLDVKAEKITIGIFTEAKEGDYYDWIPTFAGVKVTEWAEWQASLNTALVSYYAFETTGTPYLDSITSTSNDLTTMTGTVASTASGKIGRGVDIADGNNFIYSESNVGIIGNQNRSICFWTYLDSVLTEFYWLSLGNATSNGNSYAMGYYNSATYYLMVSKTGTDYATTVNTGTGWSFHCTTFDGSTLRWYVNGTSVKNLSASFNTLDYPISVGAYTYAGNTHSIDGRIDELGIWNRSLSGTEVVTLFASGEGMTYTSAKPTITLNAPVDTYNSTSSSITFNASAVSVVGISNVTLYLNGVANETNSSGINNTDYIFSKTISDGNHNWSIYSCNSDGCSTSATRTFRIDTTKPVLSDIALNASTVYTVGEAILLNVTATDANLGSCWYNYNGVNTTIAGCTTGVRSQAIITTVAGQTAIQVWANDTFGWISNPYTVNFTFDATAPTISVTSPTGTYDLLYDDYNHTLTATITDTNIDKCWYDYNGTNTTFTCSTGVAATSYFNQSLINFDLRVWANDTIGNINSTPTSWLYRLFRNNRTYDESVLEGISTTFTLNITTNGTDITTTYLNYDGTNYGATITSSGNTYWITRTINAPAVTSDSNKTWYWNITMRDGFNYANSALNQTVIALNVDNCTTNSILLYNFTNVDEEYQTILNTTDRATIGKVDLQIYAYGTQTELFDYYKLYNDTNPFAICFNDSITTQQYNIDVQVEYGSDLYETEFYNIQNATLDSTTLGQNITLYDLNTTDSQVFKIIYKDGSFLSVPDALVYVYRKYIDEGTFKIVEIPKTDANGETLAHLVVNDVIYNFVIIKNGVTLGTFSNVRAVCQNPTITTCTIDFNSYSSAIVVPDYTTAIDFNYTLTYNETSRVVTSQFVVPSGTASNITLNVAREDQLGTVYCTDSVTATSGTLSCVVPNNFGNATALVSLYKDGEFQSYGQLNLGQTPEDIYGGAQIILGIFVLMTLIGLGLSDNPVYTAIFLFIGIACLFGMRIIEGNGFYGSLATILFILTAIVIVIIKGGKRN